MLFIEKAAYICTMDETERELVDHSILMDGPVIKEIGKDLVPPLESTWIDGRDFWVFPGLINTHHHMYQTLTRGILKVQEVTLFDWLKTLYPLWATLSEEGVFLSTRLALAELMRSGCTTVSDHHYVFPKNQKSTLIDTQIEGARELGVRFHPCRGSMSLSVKDGGLPPESVVQKEEEILLDSERLIRAYHDPNPYSLCRVVLAPCSPFSVTATLMRETILLARRFGVCCHTHLAETKDEEAYCLSRQGMRPLAYMEELEWVGPDVWYAHGVHFSAEELDVLARTHTGVCHCPVSNQKLSSGVANIPAMMKRNMRVGLGVDGSASNDGGSFLQEMKSALLLHKLSFGIDSITARQVLALATKGGARVLDRRDIGSIAVGMAADMFMVNRNRLEYAGCEDPVTALLTCSTGPVDTSIIHGKVVVKEGRVLGIHEEELAKRVHKEASRMKALLS